MLAELFADKAIKAKEKTEMLGRLLLTKKMTSEVLIDFAETSKDPVKATCIEALEFATKIQPNLINETTFNYVVGTLKSPAPRVKWESAKVIGNTAHLFSEKLNDAVNHLLDNSEHDGTVVRWSAAFALGEILKLKTNINADLLQAIEIILVREEKNSIKKIYLDAIKKTAK